MTEIAAVVATSATGLATAGIAVAAAIDPSVANIVGVCVGAAVTVTMGFMAYKTVALNKKLDAQKATNDLTLEKAAVIEGHVNSRETKYQGEIAALQQEVRLLRDVLSEKKETAALLAQSTATIPAEHKKE